MPPEHAGQLAHEAAGQERASRGTSPGDDHLIFFSNLAAGKKFNKHGIIVFNIFNTGTLIFFIREIQV